MTDLSPWRRVSDEPPTNTWIETRREGEDGTNVCMFIKSWWGEVEWVERGTGVTTITHHSFAPPTHWRWLAP